MPSKPWPKELMRYVPRIESAAIIGTKVEDALRTYWPGVFWPENPLPERSSTAIGIVIYSIGLFSAVRQVRSTIRDQWRTGSLVVVPLSTRFLFEMWGAIHFSRLTLGRLMVHDALDQATGRAVRLLLGSRSGVGLPWGGVSGQRSLNVLDFIRALGDTCPNAEEFYAFLSDTSHPSFVQNLWFHMAGPPIANWGNALFSEHVHGLLEKTLSAFELASHGTEDDVIAILDEGTRLVQTAS